MDMIPHLDRLDPSLHPHLHELEGRVVPDHHVLLPADGDDAFQWIAHLTAPPVGREGG